ncbi:YesL family protein [Ferdinandcohnia sp. Marseille-Q9671]
MEMSRLWSGIYNLCKWITHLAYLHILWVLFTVLGVGVLGIFPSTAAMFAVARKKAMGIEDVPTFTTFWKTYRSEFMRANVLGLLLIVIGLIWYFDLQFFRQFEGSFYTVLNYLMMMVGLVYIILLLFIFPVFVHFDLKIYQYITHALKIGFLRPATLVMLLIGSVGTYYFLITFPGMIPLFGISFFVYFNMWIAYKSFETINDVSEHSLV